MSSETLIRDLCERVVAAEGVELEDAISDLQAALAAHVRSIRVMAGMTLLAHKPPFEMSSPA